MTDQHNTSPHRRPNQPYYRRTGQPRTSVPNARDELERERELYSAHDPNSSTTTPAQRWHESRQAQSQVQQRPHAHRPQQETRHQQENQDGRRRQEATGSIPSIPSPGEHPYRAQPTGRIPGAEQYSRRAYGDDSAHTAHRRSTAGGANLREEAAAYGAGRYRQVSTKRNQPTGAGRKTFMALAIVIAVVAVGVFGFRAWADAQPITVTVNGEQKTLQGDERSVTGMLDAGIISVTPGNYLAVDGSVLRQGEGVRAVAQVNGQDHSDLGARLNDGDDISVQNGTDLTEDYTEGETTVQPHGVKIEGTGAVHLYMGDGQDGQKVTRTGKESGITADVVTQEAKDETVRYYNVDSKGEKVVALTFDDGPWDKQTSEILDILKENEAKATFFTIGNQIANHKDVVKRAADEGHEISTHTYDHAAGSGQGVSLIKMSDQERKDEITKGYDAIKEATGQDASAIIRSPGGNFDQSVATSLDGLAKADINWNVDTEDWRRPGADIIAQRIESVAPGHIILMHDGGGDRSQTVAALRQALPVLKSQGFEFVTVQELIDRYPYQEGQSNA